MQCEQPSNNSSSLNGQYLQHILSSRLLEIYNQSIKDISIQNDRIQQIKQIIRLKLQNHLQAYQAIKQVQQFLTQHGRFFSKQEISLYLNICNQIVLYQYNLDQKMEIQSSNSKKGIQCQQLMIKVNLKMIKTIYFKSDSSRIKSSSNELKFEFKALVLDLITLIINSQKNIQNREENNCKKQSILLNFIKENNLIQNLIPKYCHCQILKKAEPLIIFCIKTGLMSEKQFFNLITNFFNKQIQYKRISQRLLEISVTFKFVEWFQSYFRLIDQYLLILSPQKFEQSTISFFKKLVEAILSSKQLLKRQEDRLQNSFLRVIQKLKCFSKQKNLKTGIKASLNELYYDSIRNIFTQPQIKKQIIKLFCADLQSLTQELEKSNTNQIKNDYIKQKKGLNQNLRQISDQLIALLKEFSSFISELKKQQRILRQQICLQLVQGCAFLRTIQNCLFYSKKTKQQYQNPKIFAETIFYQLNMVKVVLQRGHLNQDIVKSTISDVYHILKGSTQFIQWITQFSQSIQDEIFLIFFSDPNQYVKDFANLSLEGFKIVKKIFLSINYKKNNFIISSYNNEFGISFNLSKSQAFRGNFFYNELELEINVNENQFPSEDDIFEMIPLKDLIQNWSGIIFFIQMGILTKNIEIKRQILQILMGNKTLNLISDEHIENIQNKFIEGCYLEIKNLLQKNEGDKQKISIQICNYVETILLFIQLEQLRKPQLPKELRFNELQTSFQFIVQFKIIDDFNAFQKQDGFNAEIDLSKLETKIFSIAVNQNSFLKSCIKKLANQITTNDKHYLQFQAKYFCLQTPKPFSFKSQSNQFKSQSNIILNPWTSLNQLGSTELYLINKNVYNLTGFKFLNKKKKLQICYQFSQKIFQFCSIQMKILLPENLEKLNQIWCQRQQFYQLLAYLNSLIDLCKENMITKYFFVKFIFEGLESDDFKFKIFLHQLTITLQQVFEHKNIQQSTFIRKKYIQNQEFVKLLFGICSHKDINRQCTFSVNRLIQVLSSQSFCFQSEFYSIPNLLLSNQSILKKKCTLRLTLHKLIISPESKIVWKQKQYSLTVLKILTPEFLESIQNKELIELLIQHILVDFSSEQLVRQINSIFAQQMIHLRKGSSQEMEIDDDNKFELKNNSQSIEQNEKQQNYTQTIIKKFNAKQFSNLIQSLIKKFSHDEVRQKLLVKSTIIIFWQYLMFHKKQSQVIQLLIFGIQKILINQGRNLQISEIWQAAYLYLIKRTSILNQQNHRALITNFLERFNKSLQLFNQGQKSKEHHHQYIIQKQINNKQLQNIQSISLPSIQMLSQIIFIELQQYANRNKNRILSQQEQNFVVYLLIELQDSINAIPPEQLFLNQNISSTAQSLQKLIFNCLSQLLILIQNFIKIDRSELNNMNWKVIGNHLFNLTSGEVHSSHKIVQGHLQDQYIKPSLIMSQKNRYIAFNIISQIAKRSPDFVKSQIFDNMIFPTLQKISQSHNFSDSQISLKNTNQKVGLINQGNTCYMNSLLQVLFSIQQIQNNVILNVGQNSDSLPIFQLYSVFLNLKYSNEAYYNPIGFVNSIKDRINVQVQQDTTQFFHILQDLFEIAKKDKIFKQIMQGSVLSETICQHCQDLKRKSEIFYFYTVDIKNFDNLESAIANMSRQQIISDYLCPKCKKSTTILKRNFIQSTSEYLFIHLNRINFNYHQGKLIKIHQRVQFPKTLHSNSLFLNQNKNQQLNSKEQHQNLDQKDKDFDLYAIIVHRGNGQAGHYFSYVKNDHGNKSSNNELGWLCYNDKYVQPISQNEFMQKCYGVKQQEQMNQSQNAYVLVYKNKTKKQQRKQNSQSQIKQKQNDAKMIENILEQNQMRLLCFLINQVDPQTKRNIFLNFILNLLKIQHQNQINLQKIPIYLQISLSFIIGSRISNSQFFLAQSIQYLKQNSQQIPFQVIDFYFLKNRKFFQDLFLDRNHSNNPEKQSFLTQVFSIILIASLKRSAFGAQSSEQQSQMIEVSNKNKKLKQNQQINNFLLYLFGLLDIEIKTEDKRVQSKVQTILRYINQLFKCKIIYLHKSFCNQICSIVSINQFLNKFKTNYFENKQTNIQVFILLSNIVCFTQAKFQAQSPTSALLQNQSKAFHLQNANQTGYEQKIQNEEQTILNKQIIENLTSDQFWSKTINIIQDYNLRKEFNEQIKQPLQIILNYALSNSILFRSKFRLFIESKLNQVIQSVSINLYNFQFYFIWLQVFEISFFNQIQDQEYLAYEQFVNYNKIEQLQVFFNNFMKFKLLIPSFRQNFQLVFDSIQKSIVSLILSISQRANDNSSRQMETESAERTKQALKPHFSYQLLLSNNLKELIQFMDQYFSILDRIMKIQTFNLKQNKKQYLKSLNTYFVQQFVSSHASQLILALNQKYQSSQISQNLATEFRIEQDLPASAIDKNATSVHMIRQNQQIEVGKMQQNRIQFYKQMFFFFFQVQQSIQHYHRDCSEGITFIEKNIAMKQIQSYKLNQKQGQCLKQRQNYIKNTVQKEKINQNVQKYYIFKNKLTILKSSFSQFLSLLKIRQIQTQSIKQLEISLTKRGNLLEIQNQFRQQNKGLEQQPLKVWLNLRIQENEKITSKIKLLKVQEIKVQNLIQSEDDESVKPYFYLFSLEILIDQIKAYQIKQNQLLVQFQYLVPKKQFQSKQQLWSNETIIQQMSQQRQKAKISEEPIFQNQSERDQIQGKESNQKIQLSKGYILLQIIQLSQNFEVQIQKEQKEYKKEQSQYENNFKPISVEYLNFEGKINVKICFKKILFSKSYETLDIRTKISFLVNQMASQ